jgi:hypothetical protein
MVPREYHAIYRRSCIIVDRSEFYHLSINYVTNNSNRKRTRRPATLALILHVYQKNWTKSGCPQESDLIEIKERLEMCEKDFRTLQNDIINIDEGKIAMK